MLQCSYAARMITMPNNHIRRLAPVETLNYFDKLRRLRVAGSGNTAVAARRTN